MAEFFQRGTTPDRFFWALQGFEEKLYAGTYGTPKIYDYPPWRCLRESLAAGESITDFQVFKEKLYASTEAKGYIYTKGPLGDWPRVHEDILIYVLNLVEFKDYLYAYIYDPSQKSKVVRTPDGINWHTVAEWDGLFIRNFVVFDNELYLFGRRNSDYKVWAKKTSDGTTWRDISNLCGIANGHWNWPTVFNSKLYIGMANRPDGKSKIYSYDRATLKEVFSVIAGSPNSAIVFNSSLWFLIGPKWKTAGTTSLYTSTSGEAGTWQMIKRFENRSNGRCMGILNNHLFLGIDNIIYEMQLEEEPPPTERYINIKASEDAYIDSLYPDQTGAKNFLRVGVKYNVRRSESCIKFPLVNLPEGKPILRATLNLYCNNQRGNVVGNPCKMADDWTEGRVTWNNAPSAGASLGNFSAGTEWKKLDVTSYVQAEWPGDKIVSFRIRANTNIGGYWDGQTFNDRESASGQPYLQITYEELEEEEEVITTTTITCLSCGSTLELSISSIPEKNTQQNCPLCREPAD